MTRWSTYIFFLLLSINSVFSQPEFIKVDQFGYLPNAEKVAVLSDPVVGYNASQSYTPGNSIEVIDVISGSTVFTGSPQIWNTGATHTTSGDRAWWLDFSAVATPGTYYINDPANQISSDTFEINESVYHIIHQLAFKSFYYQRCGVSKEIPYCLNGYADAACHIGTLQDLNCRSIITQNAASELDLSGGWHDAGDYNKYVNFLWGTMIDMLLAYDNYPAAWNDDMDIPESGNYIPDLLDEIKVETDWLLKMQQASGEVLSIVGVTGGYASPPSADSFQRFYGPATTSASFTAATIFALAAIQFEKINCVEAENYAAILETAAIDAYDWAVANPNETFSNSGVVGAGEQEVDDYGREMRQLTAAIYLFGLTADNTYKTHVDTSYDDSHMIQWGYVYAFEQAIQQSLLFYAGLSNANAAVAQVIKDDFKNSVLFSADNYPAYTAQSDAYRAFLSDANHGWGSNQIKMSKANIYQSFKKYGLDPNLDGVMEDIMGDYVHYMHGVNPNQLVYLTNVNAYGAENSCNTIYHAWFSDGSALWDEVGISTYGPAPGFIPGGPNPSYSLDACCPTGCGSANVDCIVLDPPSNQPILKSYLDWNTNWPQNSWEVTENAIYYQAAYLQGLSPFVDRTPAAIPMSEQTIVGGANILIEDNSAGLVLKDPNEDLYRISVDTNGELVIATVTTTSNVFSKIVNTNLAISQIAAGIILKDSNGQYWKLYVSPQGKIETELIVGGIPNSLKIETGDLIFDENEKLILLKNANGICYAIKINIGGNLICESIPCS